MGSAREYEKNNVQESERALGTSIMKTFTTNKLFTPIQVGPMELKHRVVMGPLTRSRSVSRGIFRAI
jgi:NADH:flavin oxidoreductase / NADH oxidase family